MRANRIVSLLPSGTEIVCALGCADRLKGRSCECDFPPEIRALPACASWRPAREASGSDTAREARLPAQRALSVCEIDWDQLRRLRPDLILTAARREEGADGLSDLEGALAKAPWLGSRPRIISLSPSRLAEVWRDIQTVADALGIGQRGRDLLTALKERVVDVIQKTCLIQRRPAVACLDWLDPLMAAGHWVPEMVDFAGGRNLPGQAGLPASRLEWETLRQSDPDIIVLMPCGLDLAGARHEAPALEQKPEWKALRAVKTGRVFLADGNSYFSRPGPRLVDSLEILAAIIQPSLFPAFRVGEAWQNARGRDNGNPREKGMVVGDGFEPSKA